MGREPTAAMANAVSKPTICVGCGIQISFAATSTLQITKGVFVRPITHKHAEIPSPNKVNIGNIDDSLFQRMCQEFFIEASKANVATENSAKKTATVAYGNLRKRAAESNMKR